MKGHIRERGKGNWYAVIDVRDPATGRRKRKWHSLEAKGKRQAEIECTALVSFPYELTKEIGLIWRENPTCHTGGIWMTI
jgi:hypothetical protein